MANVYVVYDHQEGEPVAAFESEKDAQDFIDEESSEDEIDDGRGEVFELYLNRRKKTCQKRKSKKKR